MNFLEININITYMQQFDKENLLIFAKKIKVLRTAQSKSLNKFVFGKGLLTTATWSRIENGNVDLKFSTLLKVAKMLNITPDELLKDIKFNNNFPEN